MTRHPSDVIDREPLTLFDDSPLPAWCWICETDKAVCRPDPVEPGLWRCAECAALDDTAAVKAGEERDR